MHDATERCQSIEEMPEGIEIKILWSDVDIIQFRVRCSNGCFSGETTLYDVHERLPQIHAALSGFPSNPSDQRTVELGALNPGYALGGVQFRFYCIDSVGHASVDVKLRADACRGFGEVESVALTIPIEAAGVDSFLSEIAKMDSEKIGAKAHLPMVGR